MAVQTRKFEFQKDVPVDEINRFFQDNNIDRTQVLSVQVIQKTPNAGVFMVTYEDTIQPFVVGTSPANGADGVPAGTQIIIQFSEAVQTVLAVDLEVTRNGLPVVVLDGDIVTSGPKVTISNVVNTTYGASYVVTLKTSIKDLNNNAMAQPYVLQFTAISQTNALIKKGAIVTPDATNISNGYIDVAFVSSMPDTNYIITTQLGGVNASPSVILRVYSKATSGFRIYFDGENFLTVETGINNADAALAAAIDSAHTSQINSQHANIAHAAPQNALTGLVTAPPGGASCADRSFQLGNWIEWTATYGLSG